MYTCINVYMYIYIYWTLPKHWFTVDSVKLNINRLFSWKKKLHTAFQSLVYIYICKLIVYTYMPCPFQHVHYTGLSSESIIGRCSTKNALLTEKDIVMLL